MTDETRQLPTKTMSHGDLSSSEKMLLEWLAREDFSQYGECYGEALNGLVAKGLVQIHDDGSNQIGFIARGRSLMHLAVSLTDAGKQLCNSQRSEGA